MDIESTLQRRSTGEVHRWSRRHVRCAAASTLLVLWLTFVVLGATAGAVDVSPSAPPGVNGLQDLLDWTSYGGAMACAGTAIYGFSKMGIAHTQQSYQGANHGKAVAFLALLGALGLGLTPTIVNALTAIH